MAPPKKPPKNLMRRTAQHKSTLHCPGLLRLKINLFPSLGVDIPGIRLGGSDFPYLFCQIYALEFAAGLRV